MKRRWVQGYLVCWVWLCVLVGSPWAQVQIPFGWKNSPVLSGEGNSSLSASASSATSISHQVTTPRVQAQLMAWAPQGVVAGQVFWLGLHIQHQAQWHTYWKNPGDSGLPTELDWTLPSGFKAGEIQWPVPHPIRIGTLTNLGYEGAVLLPVPVKIPTNWSPEEQTSLPVRLKASWLVCRQECIPEQGEFALDIPLGSSIAADTATFEAALAAKPHELPGSQQARLDDHAITLTIQNLPAAWRGQALHVLSESPEVVQTAVVQDARWDGTTWTGRLPLSAQRTTQPRHLPVVLTLQNHAPSSATHTDPKILGWRTVLRPQGTWPGTSPVVEISPKLQTALDKNKAENGQPVVATNDAKNAAFSASSNGATSGALSTGVYSASSSSQTPSTAPVAPVNASQTTPADTTIQTTSPTALTPTPLQPPGSDLSSASVSTSAWILALIGAWVGGLLLNLMPCVFPVLAIKLLSLVQAPNTFHNPHDKGAHVPNKGRHNARSQALAYCAGVVGSFLALGAFMLVVRQAGTQLGWGFQLQSPAIVAALVILFALIALNLGGFFELNSWLPSRLANARARHPVVDASLSGVLSVAIASPCTAPFMGASLGLTLSMPAAQALAIFAALGLGMCSPFLLVAAAPGSVQRLIQRLPRSGTWMRTWKEFLAWPMWATVVWLLWVLGQQSGIDGVSALLALLTALCAVIWASQVQGRWRWGLVPLMLLALGWIGFNWGTYIIHPTTPPSASSAVSTTPGSSSPQWQAWSPAVQQDMLRSARPVFVDYTAAWCITCQYNKRTTLSDPDLLRDMAAHNVALLRADWTRQDPTITASLHAMGRNGVPVYVIQRPGHPPVILSEILSIKQVRQALNL